MTKVEETLTPQQNEKGKYGYVNPQGKTVIPFEYDDIFVNDINEKVFSTVVKHRKPCNGFLFEYGKRGLLEIAGKKVKKVLDCKYDHVRITEDNGKYKIETADWRTECFWK